MHNYLIIYLLVAGQNPVDIAAAFADPRVYDIVRLKFDSLPAPNDKKKGKGKGAKGRPKSSGTGDGGKVSLLNHLLFNIRKTFNSFTIFIKCP